MGKLDGKVAIVTGAGRGVGRAICLAYAAEGARVVAASRTLSRVEELVREIEAAGGSAIAVACDVGERAQIEAAVQKAAATYGTVDILVNNAQGFGTAAAPRTSSGHTPLEDYDDAEWEYTFRTGATATYWAMKAAFPYLKRRGGKIINFGSSAAQRGVAGSAAYSATKEAVRALSRVAAREWGRYRINVNVMNPLMETDTLREMRQNLPVVAENLRTQIALGRVGDPLRDAGPVAVFLASADSDYLTGMTVMVDGGYYIAP